MYYLHENAIHRGDSLDLMTRLRPGSVDLVMTSPPYAMQRRRQYGGVPENEYPAWTVAWLEALRPALTPTASVLINLRPHVRDGQISDYVLRTRLAIRAVGWKEIDEIIWHKPDAPALERADRPRRAYESILWYSRTGQRAGTPYADLRAAGSVRKPGGGMRSAKSYIHQISRCEYKNDHERARITNVIRAAVGSIDHGIAHPAMYPRGVPEVLIQTFCPPAGLVLDPFVGSGTTALVAQRLGRRWIGMDRIGEFVALARRRLAAERLGVAA